MKNLFKTTLLATLFVFASSFQLSAESNEAIAVDKDTFSEALSKALQHENEGVRMDALRQMALYAPNLDLSDAIFDIVKIYRSADDENTRILALQVLAESNSKWAEDFLVRSVRFEKSERVLRHTKAALREVNS